jgi:hypothetical protein
MPIDYGACASAGGGADGGSLDQPWWAVPDVADYLVVLAFGLNLAQLGKITD